jgi:galactokinase
LKTAFGLEMDGFQAALYCQILENKIVGAPTGITNHVAVTLGQKNSAMVLRCQPHELQRMFSLPSGLQWVGIYSGVSHAQKESRYRDLRIASFMGKKIIFENSKSLSEPPDFGGYLCNVEITEWEKRYRKMVLAKITGQEFVKRFQTHDDPATVINTEKRYQPRPATEHHLLENKRCERLLELLDGNNGHDRQNCIEAGLLMYESHTSYTENCGLGSKETDLLIDLIKAQGPEKGVFGAKATGWGSGGTVAVLAAKGSEDTLHNIVSQYRNMTALEPYLFFGSSYGAIEMGVIRVVFD